MAKQSQSIQTGLLDGADVRINTVHNQGLSEYAVIINLGTVAQPMSGWVLASLRGAAFFTFPDDLILLPRCIIVIHSGRDAVRRNAQDRLFWTEEQIWNNQHDRALLFDSAGYEVDRYTYPPTSTLARSVRQPTRLVASDDGWSVEDEPRHMPERENLHAAGWRR